MICQGCLQPIPEGQEGVIHCNSEFGYAVLKTHKDQICGKLALAGKPGWKMRKGNKPPKTKGKGTEV